MGGQVLWGTPSTQFAIPFQSDPSPFSLRPSHVDPSSTSYVHYFFYVPSSVFLPHTRLQPLARPAHSESALDSPLLQTYGLGVPPVSPAALLKMHPVCAVDKGRSRSSRRLSLPCRAASSAALRSRSKEITVRIISRSNHPCPPPLRRLAVTCNCRRLCIIDRVAENQVSCWPAFGPIPSHSLCQALRTVKLWFTHVQSFRQVHNGQQPEAHRSRAYSKRSQILHGHWSAVAVVSVYGLGSPMP